MAELVDHGRTGLHFNSGDSSDLANQIDFLITNSHLRQQMRVEARKEFERKFTADHNYEQLNKIYTRMIDAMTINMRVAAPHVTSEE